MGGNLDCPAFDDATAAYTSTLSFLQTEGNNKALYDAVGPQLLSEVLSDYEWDYYSAYAIYDYLDYQNTHNATAAALFSAPEFVNATTNISYVSQLQWLADTQQYAQLGNLAAINSVTNITYPTEGSISTIAGNLLASWLLAQLQVYIDTDGDFYAFSVAVGDYQPMMSFFALAGLPDIDTNFYGLPSYASAMVFELFSYTNGSDDATFPSSDDLYVRFYFRNGTGDDATYLSYPLFGNGPDDTDMSWTDFQDAMYEVTMDDVGDWCTQCGACELADALHHEDANNRH